MCFLLCVKFYCIGIYAENQHGTLQSMQLNLQTVPIKQDHLFKAAVLPLDERVGSRTPNSRLGSLNAERILKYWSGMQDSNLRPLTSKASRLTWLTIIPDENLLTGMKFTHQLPPMSNRNNLQWADIWNSEFSNHDWALWISFKVGAGGETRTHGGFPTPYKSVAIAAMRHQHINSEYVFFHQLKVVKFAECTL